MQRAGCLFRLKCIIFRRDSDSEESKSSKGCSAFGASFLAAGPHSPQLLSSLEALGAAPTDLQCFSLLATFGFWARQPGA